MERTHTSKSRHGQLAKIACQACRRLKMKCVASDNGVCVRCRKTGRRCVFPFNLEHQQHASYPLTPDLNFVHNGVASNNSHAISPAFEDVQWAWNTFDSWHGPFNADGPFAPALGASKINKSASSLFPQASITSPIPFVAHPPTPTQNVTHGTTLSTAPQNPEWSRKGLFSGSGHKLPNDEEMSHLCQFFQLNLLPHLPILATNDVYDFAELVKKKKASFACSIAYIAARFVPGCIEIQELLTPEITAIVKVASGRTSHFNLDEDQRWTMLQSVAVLYTWSEPQVLGLDSDAPEASHWLNMDTLRAAIEGFAIRCGYHKSGGDYASQQKDNHEHGGIRESSASRSYTYRMWMFGSSHHHALLMRIPPTIREDSSIRSASQLLNNMTDDISVQQILLEVNLALLWLDDGLRQRNLGEWWCSMPNNLTLSSAFTILRDMDERLDKWHQHWQGRERHSKTCSTAEAVRTSRLEFYYCFNRFCFNTYVAKLYLSSTLAESSPLSIVNLIRSSVDSATALCRIPLQLTPLAKSSVRFHPTTVFAMIALCSEYVIRAHTMLPDLNVVQPEHLTAVRGVAEFMVDLGMDNKSMAKMDGQAVLAQLDAGTSNLSWNATQKRLDQQVGPETGVSSTIAPRTLLESVTAIDQVWPVVSYSPKLCLVS